MAITYKWNVNTMDVAPSANGLSDVVKVIHWRLSATDGQYYTDSYSTVSLDAPDAENFTSFDSLTEEQVIAWVESKVDVENVKTGLQNQLAALANPPIVVKTGAWNLAPAAPPVNVPSE
jgi:hypothetical protein